VALARRIDRLLNQEGYTIRGVQQLLAARGGEGEAPAAACPTPLAPQDLLRELRAIRDDLAEALEQDLAAAR
jgi:DNA-binding transcriptional MerR regulator